MSRTSWVLTMIICIVNLYVWDNYKYFSNRFYYQSCLDSILFIPSRANCIKIQFRTFFANSIFPNSGLVEDRSWEGVFLPPIKNSILHLDFSGLPCLETLWNIRPTVFSQDLNDAESNKACVRERLMLELLREKQKWIADNIGMVQPKTGHPRSPEPNNLLIP